jgi:hypothetical protein
MAKLQTRNDLYADLQIELRKTLSELPFHHYKTHDGTVESGHLLRHDVYQRLLLCVEWTWGPRAREGGEQPTATALMNTRVTR